MLTLKTEIIAWEMSEPFTISRGTQTHADALLVTLTDAAGHRGRGEAYGIPYEGETPEGLRRQIETVRPRIEAGLTRRALLELLPHGGARCAVDLALWDLEAKQSGVPVWEAIGATEGRTVLSAFTISMRSIEETARIAARYADYPVLKVKVNADSPLRVIEAVHRAAPNASLIVDPNQSWTLEQLIEWTPALTDLSVRLLEQPLAVGADEGLRGHRSPIPICADELIHDLDDLGKAVGKYQVINIKLDKSGGLTEGLRLARAALAEGFDLMVGCMAGSSLAMAPAALLAQACRYVDLDGPLLQKDDWPEAIRYERGLMSFPSRELWG